MTVYELLEKLKMMARDDSELKAKILATKNDEHPYAAFCQLAATVGVDINVIDLINAGEESYAAMRRSTNGGGENSPLLQGEDDLYEMFLVELM